jgi:hypothetical protein
MLTSPIVLLMSALTLTVDFLPVWEFGQNAINFSYGVHLRKKIYGRNQRDETDTMDAGFIRFQELLFLSIFLDLRILLDQSSPLGSFWTSKSLVSVGK